MGEDGRIKAGFGGKFNGMKPDEAFESVKSNDPTKSPDTDNTVSGITERWGVSNVQIDSLDEKAVSGVLEQMDAVFQKTGITGVDNIVEDIGQGTFATAGVELDENGITLYLNPHHFSDVDKLESWYNKNDGLFPDGTTWKDIGSHEAGHILVAEITRKLYPDPKEANKMFNNDSVADRIVTSALSESNLTDSDRIRMFKSYLGNDYDPKSDTDADLLSYYNKRVRPDAHDKKTGNDLRQIQLSGISKYAKSNPSETVAEAFSDVTRNGDNADVSSQIIVKEVKKWLNE